MGNVDRLTRVNELLKREIGESLYHVIQEDDFDLSAVTVTNVETGRNLHTARVYVSIRDHHEQRQRMMSLLRQHRVKLQERISKKVILKYTPRLMFVLDKSIEKGDQVLGLLHTMERKGELDPADNDTEAGPLEGEDQA